MTAGISQPAPRLVRWCAIPALAFSIASCGGEDANSGGGGVAVVPTPSPTPSPSSSPPPVPKPSATLTSVGAPALAISGDGPPSPQASAGGPDFYTQPTESLTFPVLQSTIAVRQNALVADHDTMKGGSSFDFAFCSGCRETFALSVPNLGLSHVGLSTYADTPFYSLEAGQESIFVVEETWGHGDLSSTKFGYWYLGPSAASFPYVHSAYVYGYETPTASLPSSGTVTYTGRVIGRVFYSLGPTYANIVSGKATVRVDFAARTVTGELTEMGTNDDENSFESGFWNDVSFSASFPADANHATGEARASSTSGTLSAMNDSTGTVALRFYGAGARELGLVWTLHRGSRAALGSSGIAR